MDEAHQEALETLFRTGSTVLRLPDGKRVFFVASAGLSMPSDQKRPGILIASEGSGCVFWEVGSKLTKFTLFNNGFSLIVAPIIVRMVEELQCQYRSVERHNGKSIELKALPRQRQRPAT